MNLCSSIYQGERRHMVSRLELMLATLRHEATGEVPMAENFGDSNSQAKHLGAVSDISDRRQRALYVARQTGACMIRVVDTEFKYKVGTHGQGWYSAEFETGSRWIMHLRPTWWREYEGHPLADSEDLGLMRLPNPDDPDRYAGVAEAAKFFEGEGYMPVGRLLGFFSGVWYYWRPFEKFLMDLVERKDFAHALVDRMGEYNLRAAEQVLRRGVPCINFPDDLGYNTGTFFSPSILREFFLPWYKRLADLTHSYGAFVNMHSHGNLSSIVGELVETGIDMLNPIGPGDNMDLAAIKERYGSRITLVGGLSKRIGMMSIPEIEEHVRQVVEVGRQGGGYVVQSEGGIPENMSTECYEAYMSALRRHCSATW